MKVSISSVSLLCHCVDGPLLLYMMLSSILLRREMFYLDFNSKLEPPIEMRSTSIYSTCSFGFDENHDHVGVSMFGNALIVNVVSQE